jgi:phosphoglycerate dehydrogenase-like enzyme
VSTVITVMLGMDSDTLDRVLTPRLRARLERVAYVAADRFAGVPREDAGVLGEVEVLLTGWGCPRITAEVLDAAPNLRAIVHAAGTVKTFVDPVVFSRGITVSTAVSANAVPVAEFTVAAIVMAGKRAFRLSAEYSRTGRKPDAHPPGNNGTTVGILGASRIGRMVIDRLRAFDFTVLVSDPYLEDSVGLDRLFGESDIVSIHAPLLPETEHLVDARLLSRMRDGAVLINTARGRIVDHAALERECVSGRIDAILDVTDPEPLPADSPLFRLPNVFVTPHLAGALGNEVERLGEVAVGEIERYAAGRPLQHAIDPSEFDRIA